MSKYPPQDYASTFKSFFDGQGTAGFGRDQGRLEERHQRERKAGRTLRQRARRATRTAVINVRVEPELKDLCAALATRLKGSQADIIHEAIRRLAEQEGILGGNDA